MREALFIEALMDLFEAIGRLPEEHANLDPELAVQVGQAHNRAAFELATAYGLSKETVSIALLGAMKTVMLERPEFTEEQAQEVAGSTLQIAFQITQTTSKDLPN